MYFKSILGFSQKWKITLQNEYLGCYIFTVIVPQQQISKKCLILPLIPFNFNITTRLQVQGILANK
ncbi:Uncharacterized protein APZ42_016386 [Daphnia magna]|uniref:Uncharacterized protein n=1 Tax=Daphnia magna TaxID=35525 RepID=A0A165AD46_9CRUS|nr:Uncharacterized protein APZ42_016386 [Daphnia magna]